MKLLSQTERKEAISRLEKSIEDLDALVKKWEDEDKQKVQDLNKMPIKTAKMTIAILV